MIDNNLHKRVENLTAGQRKLLQELIAARNRESNKQENDHTQQKLVAYYVANKKQDKSEIARHIKNKLPAYMVPHNIVELHEMPRLPNGKIDVQTLRLTKKNKAVNGKHDDHIVSQIEKQLIRIWQEVLHVQPVNIDDNFFEIGGDSILSIQVVARAKKLGIELTPTQIFEQQTIAALVSQLRPDPAPAAKDEKTEIEKQLIEIWEEVLHVKPVNTDDNFFEIGGDSILSIQVVARAKKLGIELTPTQIFEQQTIAALVNNLLPKKSIEPQSGVYAGPVPLSPIQHWFFEEHKNAPHHWNDGIYFRVDSSLNEHQIKIATAHLIRRHEALRLSFKLKNGAWQAHILAPEEINAFKRFDLTGLSASAQEKVINATIAGLQSEFDLAQGSLFKVILFDCGSIQPSRICLYGHHLVYDNITWKILFDDLSGLLLQLENGKNLSLPPINNSYRDWAQQLVNLAASENIEQNYDFWKAQSKPVEYLPVDNNVNFPILEESLEIVDVAFNTTISYTYLKEASTAFNVKVEELLLSAFLLTLNNWSGLDEYCVGFENHGRIPIGEGKDYSQVVGWVTSFYPLILKIKEQEDLGGVLKSVKEQLQRVNGLSYGVLRYLRNEQAGLVQRPSLVFNYLGVQNDFNSEVLTGIRHFTVDDRSRSPKSERYYAFEINTFFVKNKLYFWWIYSKKLHSRETIDDLIGKFERNLNKLVDFCVNTKTAGFTTADFPDADLSQEDLDHLMGELG